MLTPESLVSKGLCLSSEIHSAQDQSDDGLVEHHKSRHHIQLMNA